MKQLFNYLVAAIAICLLSVGCKKSELIKYSQDDMVYIYKDAYNAKKDSTFYSFAIKSDALLEDTVFIPVRIMGVASDRDRVVKLAALDSSTAIEGTHYSFLPYKVPAGAYSADLPVVLKRTPDMKLQSFSLYIKIDESDDFKPGVPDSPVAGNFAGAGLDYLIRVSDFLVKPGNWDTQLYLFFGTYSQVKYKFIIDVTGKTEFVFGPPPQMSYGELLYYKAFVKAEYLEYEAQNGPLVDEFGAELSFP